MHKLRFPIIAQGGGQRSAKAFDFGHAAVVQPIGNYDVLWWEKSEGRGELGWVLVCCPTIRKPGRWNFTRFTVVPQSGNMVFMDQDVELDPYHMCLLYGIVQETHATWDQPKENDQ